MFNSKKEFTLVLLIIISSLLLGSSWTIAGQRVSIEIEYEVESSGRTLYLGDIAKIQGPSEHKDSLARIDLGQAPLPGYTRALNQDYILSALRRAGFDLEQIDYQIPTQIRVTTPYQTLSGNEMVNKAEEYILGSLDLAEEDVEIRVQRVSDEIRLPKGEVDLKVGNFSGRALLGRATIPIDIYVDGDFFRKNHVQVEVQAYQEVLVAQEAISRNQSLNEEQFELERKSISASSRGEPIDNFEDISGSKARRPINRGQIITENLVEIPPLVSRNEEVTIIAEVGGVNITTKGLALEDGAEGQTIQVENLTSGRELRAKVIAKDKVKVNL
ncbi:flagellar basal body P-ring formation chaperone FlgA [Fuchsiella alkaliacetigena]|uniref:flagellar basal body P-ring formation chaperone FlgA n=1 Tax=Fuchsiella alkaliacetigena TaxID=957042 RepID=UPI00200A8C4E|nr:flagellar basal body P-ring formation chaperone FlgA [Fuchsiella alkaliacetigena]MCK8824572.1 flagellar basal body P-ring formation chaperone FlgA [Fuchsiella alkaliacetigena]